MHGWQGGKGAVDRHTHHGWQGREGAEDRYTQHGWQGVEGAGLTVTIAGMAERDLWADTHHVWVVGWQSGKQRARGGVLPHRDVCMRAVKLRRVIVDVPQLDGDPSGVQVAGVSPTPTALAGRDGRGVRCRMRREIAAGRDFSHKN